MPGVLPTPLLTTTGGGAVAFTVTARHSVNSGTSSSATKATNSTTPTANSLFLVCWGQENDAVASAPAYQTPTGGSLTYTSVRTAGDSTSYPWNGDDSFRVGAAVYRADIGASPSAFAVTVDSYSSTQNGFYGVVCLDVTGHDTSSPIVGTPGIAGTSKASGNTETGTVTLGATPTAGNLIVVVFVAGADGGGGFASPTAGAGKTFTTVTNQTNSFCQTGVFYRVADGAESTTITCSDLGQTVGNYAAIAFEVAAASGGGTTGTAAVTQAGDTSSASGQLGYSGTSAATETADTSSATGTVINPVTGTAAASQASQTSSASGKLGYTGALTRTQANQTASTAGQLGYTGTVGVTQAGQTSSASGTFTGTGISGSVAVIQATQTSSASGTFTAGSVTGTVAATQAGQTSTSSGKLGYSGTSARTQANQASTASGTVINPVTGTAAVAQANQVSTATGLLRYIGAIAAIEAMDVLVAAGVVSGPVAGSAAVTQASQTAVAVGHFEPLVSFGTSSAGAGMVPSAHPNLGLAPFSAPGTLPTPTASGATSGAPTSTGA